MKMMFSWESGRTPRREGRRAAAAGRDAAVPILMKRPLVRAGTRAAAVPDSIFTVRLGALV